MKNLLIALILATCAGTPFAQAPPWKATVVMTFWLVQTPTQNHVFFTTTAAPLKSQEQCFNAVREILLPVKASIDAGAIGGTYSWTCEPV